MSQFKRLMPSFGIAIMIVYFSYHALSGDQSVSKWIAYRQAESQAQAQLALLETRRQTLDAQNQMLRNQSLDLDYLDERVRATLSYVHPDDRIIVLSDKRA
jgi:cell division protein FtsB